jgi:sigma-E factor negative regulatory protein RseC
MNSSADIEHTGIVHSVGEHGITVRIEVHPACAGCQAAGICSSSGTNEKFFHLPFQENLHKGQRVHVVTSLSNGYKALVLGYILPLFILLALLVILLAAGCSEIIAGVGSVVAVVVYYLALYLLRNRIEKKIKFTLKPA